MNISTSLFTRAAIVLLAVALYSCKGENVGPKVSSEVSGVVVSESGFPIPNAMVKAGNASATTNENGVFTFENLSLEKDRAAVAVSANGFFTQVKGFIPGESATALRFVLSEKTTTADFPASSGGAASLPNGAEVEIPSSGVVQDGGGAYNGTVNVALQHLDPTTPEFAELVSGDDLAAERANGDEATLYSYGILRVELSDNSGNELQLAPGKTATVRIPVPASMAGNAPATIPLWYLDEETGIWMEDGEATLTGGEYVGTVTHFTDWNADVPEGTGTVTGTILDCNGNPVPNWPLKLGQTMTTTDSDGKFERRVPAGVDIQVQSGAPGFSFTPVTLSPLTEGQTQSAGSIRGDCMARIKLNISSCNNGDAEFGLVMSSFNGMDQIAMFQEGEFVIAVPPNTEVSFKVYSATQGGTVSARSGVAGTTVNADVTLCDGPVIGTTEVNVSGSPLPVRRMVITPIAFFGFSTAMSVYSRGNNSTDITVVGGASSQSFAVQDVPGRSTGTFNSGTDITVLYRERIGADSVWVALESTSATTVISTYGPVGEKVTGTFTGTFSGTYYNETGTIQQQLTGITVSGKFEALRQPDED
jgi:hypothetical protein